MRPRSATRSLALAEKAYREALASRDPVAFQHAICELQVARRRVQRQKPVRR